MPLKPSFEPVTHYKSNSLDFIVSSSVWVYFNALCCCFFSCQQVAVQQWRGSAGIYHSRSGSSAAGYITHPTHTAQLLSGRRELTNAFTHSLIFPFLQSLSPQPLLCSLLCLARSQPETKQLQAVRILLTPAESSKGGCSWGGGQERKEFIFCSGLFATSFLTGQMHFWWLPTGLYLKKKLQRIWLNSMKESCRHRALAVWCLFAFKRHFCIKRKIKLQGKKNH